MAINQEAIDEFEVLDTEQAEDEFVPISGTVEYAGSHTVQSSSETATHMLMAKGTSEDLIEEHEFLSDQLLQGNKSLMKGLNMQMQHLEDTSNRTAIHSVLVDPSMPLEEKSAVVQNVLKNKKTITPDNIREEAATNVSVQNVTYSSEEEARIQDRLNNLNTYLNADDKVQEIVKDALLQIEFGSPEEKIDISKFSGLASFLGTKIANVFGTYILPTAITTTNAQIYEEVTGKIHPQSLAPGLLGKELGDLINEAQGQDKIDLAKKIVNSIKNNAGYFGYN